MTVEERKQKQREQWAAWYARNKDKPEFKAKKAAYRKRNRVRILAHQREWRQRTGYTRRYKHGMAQEDFDAMLEKQGGACALCRGECDVNPTLSVDHDHDTRKVRGLLCFDCNTGIGKLGDDPELLRRAADYIEDSRP